MDIWDLLLFTWLFEDDLKGNKEKKTKVGFISLIFGLICYYLIILVIISLILYLIDIEFSNVAFIVYTVLYCLLGLLLIIGNIISNFKR